MFALFAPERCATSCMPHFSCCLPLQSELVELCASMCLMFEALNVDIMLGFVGFLLKASSLNDGEHSEPLKFSTYCPCQWIQNFM